jgi:hypothetical protein
MATDRFPGSLRNMGKRILIIIAGMIVALLLLFVWYRTVYSMEEAQRFEVQVHGANGRVLIATQGSTYKDSVVSLLARSLAEEDVRVLVVDVHELASVDTAYWDAVVILHTWEGWKPQPDAAAFVRRYPAWDLSVVLSTSGGGEELLVPVDGISSASVLSEAQHDSRSLFERVSEILYRRKR